MAARTKCGFEACVEESPANHHNLLNIAKLKLDMLDARREGCLADLQQEDAKVISMPFARAKMPPLF